YHWAGNRVAIAAIADFCMLVVTSFAMVLDFRGGTDIRHGRGRCWCGRRLNAAVACSVIDFLDVDAAVQLPQHFGRGQRHICAVAENYQICRCETMTTLIFL